MTRRNKTTTTTHTTARPEGLTHNPTTSLNILRQVIDAAEIVEQDMDGTTVSWDRMVAVPVMRIAVDIEKSLLRPRSSAKERQTAERGALALARLIPSLTVHYMQDQTPQSGSEASGSEDARESGPVSPVLGARFEDIDRVGIGRSIAVMPAFGQDFNKTVVLVDGDEFDPETEPNSDLAAAAMVMSSLHAEAVRELNRRPGVTQ